MEKKDLFLDAFINSYDIALDYYQEKFGSNQKPLNEKVGTKVRAHLHPILASLSSFVNGKILNQFEDPKNLEELKSKLEDGVDKFLEQSQPYLDKLSKSLEQNLNKIDPQKTNRVDATIYEGINRILTNEKQASTDLYETQKSLTNQTLTTQKTEKVLNA